jgi:hypothetical protein
MCTVRFPLVEYAYDLGMKFIRLEGKKPVDANWTQTNWLSPDAIADLDEKYNLGLVTGIPSGVCVLDLDAGHSLREDQVLPDTPCVKTGSGGGHWYFKHPEDFDLRNSAGKLGPHMDIRGTGGQVVWPGSLHPKTGKVYEWIIPLDDMELAPLPSWIVRAIRQDPEKKLYLLPPPKPKGKPNSEWGQAALVREAYDLGMAEEGTRNHALNKAAFKIGQVVAGGSLDMHEARERLTNVALQIGLEPKEVEATFRSGFHKGYSQPRYPDPKRDGGIVNDAQGDKPSILVPGEHIDAEGMRIEQGNDTFADQVLDTLPEGQLYRRDLLAGVFSGAQGHRIWHNATPELMRYITDQHVRLGAWEYNKREQTSRYKYKPSTGDQGRIVLSVAHMHPSILEVKTFTHYPIYLPGLVRAKQGYNEGGVYLDLPPDLADIEPILEPGACRAWFKDLLCDFLFEDDASFDNYMALLFTAILAPAIPGNRPFFYINAAVPRTGKSKLIEEVAGEIILGRQTPALQVGSREEERVKQLGSAVLCGETLMHLDNISRELNSAALASALTSSIIAYRLLGENKVANLHNNLIICGTGNNVQFSMEIAKRILPTTLVTLDMHPERRTGFKHPNIRAYAQATRRQSLAHLLGAIEIAKMEGLDTINTPPMGGFEPWTCTVGGVCIANGFNRILGNQPDFQSQFDEETEQLTHFTDRWAAELATDTWVTPIQLVRLIADTDLLPRVQEGANLWSKAARMGRFLKQYRNSPVGKWRILARVKGNGREYKLLPSKEVRG